MIFLFRGTKIGYYVSVVLSIIGAGAISGAIFPQAFEEGAVLQTVLALPVFVLLLLLFGLICIGSLESIAGKKMQRIHQLLYDCDVEGYLAIYETFLPKVVKRQPERMSVLLGLSTGYLVQGNHAVAGQMLAGAKYSPNNRTGAFDAVYTHGNFFSVYLRNGNILLAEQVLAQMEAALSHPKLREQDSNQFWPLYAEMQALLRMEQGDYKGAEQIFDLAYQRGQSVLSKVSTKYTLAGIYLHEGRADEAGEAFSYVAQHGGSTFYKKQADIYLATGELPTPAPSEEPLPIQPPVIAAVEERAGQGVFRMNRQERKRYSLVIFTLFAVLFALYGWLGLMGQREFGEFGPFASPEMTVLFFGLFGGWGFTSLVGGIWLGCRYVRKQSNGFIVVACVFFMVTLMGFWLFGMVVTLPFAVYNIVLLRRGKKRPAAGSNN
ncbi:MAG: hypothetical protein FWE28_06405 [Oscillospiraceae bacterium]|nr:hypothetical protein [Oscillospiraceae bacterium]